MDTIDKEWLIMLADSLHNAERSGKDTDSPEGTRWITISDTMANLIEQRLREIAGTTRGDKKE